MNDQIGDTAIQWAEHIADIAYHTIAGSPRSERMRLGIVKAAYSVLNEHYGKIEWETFWRLVTSEIKILQEKERYALVREGCQIRPTHHCLRSIDDLFNVDKEA